MKRALVLMLIILLTIPFVSGGELTYYPDQKAFQAFLSSNATYRVVGGNETWAKAWAYYVDEKLSTVKERGNETLVLVGNVYNNPMIKAFWPKTGLPENASLLPSVIVLNGTVLITGTEENIYMTERAFEELWNPPVESQVSFAVLLALIAIVFMLALRKDKTYAGSFYALTLSLFVLWYLTAQIPRMSEVFLQYFLQGLKFAVGGSPDSPLGAILGGFFMVVRPIEENLVFAHWVLILLLISFSFYIAPKRARELGFIVFGLSFASPMFRNYLHHLDGTTLGLAFFLITLAIISNIPFSPNKVKAFLQTLILSTFTLLTLAINPYLAAIPLLFVMVFPKRHLRNYAYLLMTGVGLALLYVYFGLPIGVPRHVNPNGWRYLARFLLNTALAILVIVYAVIYREKSTKMRGQTPFLMMMAAIYIPLALFIPELLPYCFIILSSLVARMIYILTLQT
ncbi:hypothetical protein E3E23_05560 [Thermococcus sp. CX2]|uniref:hypothetical protein n=1 Tax=Thermococcus sp. CX2 TaxID=163006 RepID=UPI00143B4E34|nr:hypothetical protein [Thermococcus sp. CX2]NJE85291.1 hypothetical protein [Thermococcus sp. CX2]